MSLPPASQLSIPAVIVVSATVLCSSALADRPKPNGGEPCRSSWCGTEHAWHTADAGTGPETGPATNLALGAASSSTDRLAESAAVLSIDFRFPLSLRQTSRSAERAMRFHLALQTLGWRTGGAGEEANSGGSLGLGFTETLFWFSRWSKLAATFDAEGSSGLAVRSGLGLRSASRSSRAVGSAGLALGLHSRVGGFRAHARVLRSLAGDPDWENGLEWGAGFATRFDWPRWRGPWPVEVWADFRERRDLEAMQTSKTSVAFLRDRQLSVGVNYIPKDGFSRLGLIATASEARTSDGQTEIGRALMFQFNRPFGSL